MQSLERVLMCLQGAHTEWFDGTQEMGPAECLLDVIFYDYVQALTPCDLLKKHPAIPLHLQWDHVFQQGVRVRVQSCENLDSKTCRNTFSSNNVKKFVFCLSHWILANCFFTALLQSTEVWGHSFMHSSFKMQLQIFRWVEVWTLLLCLG